MDFGLTDEQREFKLAIRNFGEKEIVPSRERADETGELPIEIFSKAGELGYLCVSYPEKYGAAGADKIADCICVEEFGRSGYFSIGAALMVQSGIGTRLILQNGTEQQRQEYLVPAIKGKKIAAFGLTEPNAGSDAAAIETRATRDGDSYVLNGTKIFITNGTIADFVCVAAYTDKSKGPRGGISVFIVKKGTPGFTSSKIKKWAARGADTGQLVFEDCRIPRENLIGEEGMGFPYLMDSLFYGRVTHASRSIGMAQAAFDLSSRYAKERVQFGRPISKFQAISFKLAKMAMEIEAARCLIYQAAWTIEHKKEGYRKQAAMAKLFASEVAQRVASEAMQIYGGYGITQEYPIFPIFADLRLATITEGTSEIQQLVIARELDL